MSWGFRKSVGLGRGVRLNIGRKSAGVSFGRRGRRLSINSRTGPSAWLSLGKGVFWRKRL